MVDFKIPVGASWAPKNKFHHNHSLSNFYAAFHSELMVGVSLGSECSFFAAD